MKKHLLTVTLLVGILGIICAEKAPIKFGQIGKAELLNNVYEPDTSAPALILNDYGYYSEKNFKTVRILRIKILKKEGYNWADQTFNTHDKTAIRGITYNLENNEIVETKLKNESVFRTQITEYYYEIRVAMPNVKVGSIIDIEFTHDGIPSEWNFQQEIPVVHSELFLESTQYIKFNKNYFGYIPLDESKNNHWIAKNVPAFKSEPFITSSKNYRTRLEFDVKEVSFPGLTQTYYYNGILYQRELKGYYQGYAKSWENIRDMLLENKNMISGGYLVFLYEHFGLTLANDSYLDKKAEDIESRFTNHEEKIKAAYEFIKQIKWNRTYRLLAEKSFLSGALKEKQGSSSEINLALVQLLRKLDLDAGPVIMSTRSNGRLSEDNPSFNKLNYVIAAVFTENDTILLDATEERCPYYLLPMRSLNNKGQFIDKSRTGSIQLKTNKKDKQMVVYNLFIQDEMSLTGNITYVKGDYAALDYRNDYDGFNSDDDYVTKFKEGKSGLKVLSHQINNLDSLYKSINEVFEIASNNSVNEISGELYIMPLLFEQIKENPFKVSERKYPVDYGYARDKTILVNYTIPENYSVISLPSSASLKLPGNSASFTCKSTVADGKITILYKLNINNPIFLQDQYADLREFYNQIIASHAEPIVLKKN